MKKIQFRGETLEADVSPDGLYYYTSRGTFLRAEVVIVPEPEPEPVIKIEAVTEAEPDPEIKPEPAPIQEAEPEIKPKRSKASGKS